MQKKVSIIIPAYNVESYIGVSLRSVIQQTYRNIEILVVDDGSTDTTAQIVSEYMQKDNRIILLSQQNRGLADARNSGLNRATGEYLCIFDSDDIMLPEKIELQVAFLETHEDCDITYSDLYHFIDDTVKIYHHPMSRLGEDTYTSLLYGNYINPNVVFFRSSIYERFGGFDQSLRSAEDWDYWLTIAYSGARFMYQPERLTLYRIRTNSLSSDSIMMLKTAIQVLEKQLNRQITLLQKKIIEERLRYWNKKLYVVYLRKGEYNAAHAIRESISGNKSVLIFLGMMPLWILRLKYRFMSKIKFILRFKRVQSEKIQMYLHTI